jgi:hypothetical protein
MKKICLTLSCAFLFAIGHSQVYNVKIANEKMKYGYKYEDVQFDLQEYKINDSLILQDLEKVIGILSSSGSSYVCMSFRERGGNDNHKYSGDSLGIYCTPVYNKPYYYQDLKGYFMFGERIVLIYSIRPSFFVKTGKRKTFSYKKESYRLFEDRWLEEGPDDAFPAWELIYDGKRISVENPPDSNLLKEYGWLD